MKIKKILSLVLASIMVLALAVPAFAADTFTPNVTDISKGANVKVTGKTQGATIKVSVPTSVELIANPYKLEVTPTGGTTAVKTEIITTTQYIESQSDIPLWVGGTVTGTPSTDVKLIAADKEDDAWAAPSKSKDMFLYFAMKSVDDKTVAVGDTYADGDLIIAAKSTNIPATMSVAAELPAATTSDPSSFVGFRVNGKLATNLSTGVWNEKDKIDVAIAFTFLASKPVTE